MPTMRGPRAARAAAPELMARELALRPQEPVPAAARKARKATHSEPVAPFHPPARGDLAHDGRRGADRRGRVPAVAGLRAATGRLPDHAGADLLSGRKPGGDDVRGYCSSREAVWPGAWTDADDLDQLVR